MDTTKSRISERRTLLRLGRKLVSQLFVLIKSAQLYDERNTIAVEASESFRAALTELLDAAPDAALGLRAECLFVNEHRLRLDLAGFAAHRFIVETLRTRRIRTMRFTRRPSTVELNGFLKIFLGPAGQHGGAAIQAELDRYGIDAVEIDELDEDAEEGQGHAEPNTREATVDTYFKSIFVVKQIVERGFTHRGPNLRRAKKVVHAIVDLLFEDEASLMALTAIRSYDNRTFNHSANVCVLAVILGRQLGLSKRELGRLGIAALLHDIGKMAYHDAHPPDAEDAAEVGADDEETLTDMRCEGVKALVRYQGLTDVAIRSAIVAWEHRRVRESIGLHSHIVAIADFYENLTTPGTVSEAGVSPEEALRVMLESDTFDPLLTRVFASALGAVPLGSLVELDSGAFAVVVARDPEGGRLPTVRLVSANAGDDRPADTPIDLRHPPEGCPHREIVRALPVGEAFESTHEVVDLVEAG